MNTYHKIQTIYKRDPETKYKTLLMGQYSMPEFEYLKNNLWVFTEKIDGTNIRVIYDNANITIKGKTDNAQIPLFLFDAIAEIVNLQKTTFRELFEENVVTLYGEGYGARI